MKRDPLLLDHLVRLAARSREVPCLVKGLAAPCWTVEKPNGSGYGTIKINGRSTRAHRYAYTELIGPIPDGLDLDHRCKRPSCWNPWHMEPVTHRVNVLRGRAPAARSAVAMHCPQGHEYTPENTYRWKGARKCRACERARGATRRRSTGTSNAAKTHCSVGHEYTEDNTYRRPDGGRDCRTCRRSRTRAYSSAKRAGVTS